MAALRMAVLAAAATAALCAQAAASNAQRQQLQQAAPIRKSINMYINFPGRTVDFIVGNNSQGWANTTKGFDISAHTGIVYQCCNGFLLGADGMQASPRR
jgi:hypothetical protein